MQGVRGAAGGQSLFWISGFQVAPQSGDNAL
jgi:hypothetical protein